jgi:hypothetical protein
MGMRAQGRKKIISGVRRGLNENDRVLERILV